MAQSLADWVRSSCLGSRERESLEAQQDVGRSLAAHGYSTADIVGAFGRYREQLLARIMEWPEPIEQRLAVLAVLNRELDLELTLMLQGCGAHEHRKLQTDERLSAIAQLSISIGHELRNPLGTIETSAYLIAQRLTRLGIADEGIERHVEKVRKHVQLCSRIISDLLELARSGNPTRRRVPVEPLVDEALEAVAWPPTVTRSKAVAAELVVFADREQLLSVLVNLFENARDATGEAGKVEVQARASNGGVVFRISDSGPGISPEERTRIFEPLYSTKVGGSGLGLCLCRRIVAAHAGTLELESVAVGATFRLWFPGEVVETRCSQNTSRCGMES
jgi:signal transduction histidine kinase